MHDVKMEARVLLRKSNSLKINDIVVSCYLKA